MSTYRPSGLSKITQAMRICHKAGVYVAGSNEKGIMCVVVNEKILGRPKLKPTKSKKHHLSQKDLNNAVSLTYFYYADKITSLAK